MKLSPHFGLDEFLLSDYAARNDIDMSPSQEVIDNLAWLCESVLEPLREEIGAPIVITSGYRPPKLNEAIGGSRTSAHMHGRAADCYAIGMSIGDFAEVAAFIDGPIDQVIKEFDRWVHIGIADEPRGQVLTASRQNGQTVYQVGLV